jgi:hypothetical protein
LICGYAPRRSSCEPGLVSRVCIHRLPVKEIGLEQTGTPSIARCLFSTRGSSAPCRAAGASKNHHPQPAVTISLCVPFWGALAIRDPARFRPLRPSCCLLPADLHGATEEQAIRKLGPVVGPPRERDDILNHARPNDFCKLHTTHERVHERAIFAPVAGLPATSFPAPASLRPHMRRSEPCVPDRLEDRTPISCEWAEKEHTGRRAELKVEIDAPGARVF